MPWLTLLHSLNLFFAGLLAGLELGVHYGLGALPETLSEPAQIQLRQAFVLRLRILVPIVFLPAAASTIALALWDGAGPGVWLRRVALSALLLWIVIRALRTVPINSATLAWRPEDPPKNWKFLVEKAERFHVVAAWAAVLAFLCLLSAAALPSVSK